jgi:membrane protease YdiL (CAAX protease family)
MLPSRFGVHNIPASAAGQNIWKGRGPINGTQSGKDDSEKIPYAAKGQSLNIASAWTINLSVRASNNSLLTPRLRNTAFTAARTPAFTSSRCGLVQSTFKFFFTLLTTSRIRSHSVFAPGDLYRASPVFLSFLGLGLIAAFGEELGWRGFLLPKMVTGGISHPYFTSGLVWAGWHLPLIAFAGYYTTGHVFIMALAYGVSIIAINFVISELRMRSDSVWVATVFHASHNFFFQLAVPTLVFARPGARSDLWEIIGGDCGLIVAVLYAPSFLFLSRAFPKAIDRRFQRETAA